MEVTNANATVQGYTYHGDRCWHTENGGIQGRLARKTFQQGGPSIAIQYKSSGLYSYINNAVLYYIVPQGVQAVLHMVCRHRWAHMYVKVMYCHVVLKLCRSTVWLASHCRSSCTDVHVAHGAMVEDAFSTWLYLAKGVNSKRASRVPLYQPLR